MQAIVSAPAGGRKRESVLSLSGADYLVTDGAAAPVAATCPNVGGKAGGQLPGPNAFLGECQNLREFHRHLPCRSWARSTAQRHLHYVDPARLSVRYRT